LTITLTGTFPAEDILLLELPAPPSGVIEALSALDGAVCFVSDALDDMKINGVIPAGRLCPVLPGARMVGQALTLRKSRIDESDKLRNGRRRGDIEAHNLTRPGNVLVIEGFDDVSNMGGLSAMTSQRQGAAGAVIWGGCRDVAELRRIGYPVWSTTITPVTGVGRVDGIAINGEISLGSVAVRPGDIVVADDDGVCIVPLHRAEELFARVTARVAADTARDARIRSGASIHELATGKPSPTA
jgi:regulator of RNase E activity RraA